MRRLLLVALIPLFGLMHPFAVLGAGVSKTPAKTPQGFGLNIHFTHPQPNEMAMLAATGVQWVRMDLTWDSTEKTKGVYDFSAYDHLVEALDRHGLKAHFILDYGNPLYDGGVAPNKPQMYQAFARWALAAAGHFAGKGYLWEIWNEPNIPIFWKPKPNSKNYLDLVREVSKNFREKLPQEILVAPAMSQMDWGYLKALLQDGLLNYIDVLSVHPYRGKSPENFQSDLSKLRSLVAKFAPKGKTIPVISGEWGYSTPAGGLDEMTQAAYLVRMWLFNLSQGIPYSVWYDWHDDGPEPHEVEHHFGIVKHPYHADRNPPYETKPSYNAAKVFMEQLKGFEFVSREDIGGRKVYFLKFQRGKEIKYVFWSERKSSKPLEFSTEAGKKFLLQDMLGQSSKVVYHPEGRLTLYPGPHPQYLIPISQ